MKEERSSMLKEEKIMKTPTLSPGTNTRDSTNNGISSTSMNTQLNQRREN
jgi:hypothetical protein